MKKAIILAGGEGTRLRPITYEIPKPLIPVKKKPVIDHIIDFLTRYGFSEFGIIVSTNHRTDFEAWKKNRVATGTINFFFEERLSGTFGCLRIVRDWVGNEAFVVANGDCLVECNFDQVKAFHDAHKPIVTAPLMRVNTSGSYGIFDLEGIYAKAFLRKDVAAGSELICGGPYIFEPEIFDYDQSEKNFLNIEADIFPRLINERKIAAIAEEKSRFFDCGTLANWEKAIKEW